MVAWSGHAQEEEDYSAVLGRAGVSLGLGLVGVFPGLSTNENSLFKGVGKYFCWAA